MVDPRALSVCAATPSAASFVVAVAKFGLCHFGMFGGFVCDCALHCLYD